MKKLGVLLGAVFAVSALGASAAQGHVLESSEVAAGATIYITAEKHTETKERFTINSHNVECNVVKRFGEGTNGGELGTGAAEYRECNASGLGAVVVVMNGCSTDLRGATDAEGHGAAQITCPEGKAIELQISAIGCTITIGSQTPQGGMHYTNVQTTGKPMEVTVHETVTGIHVGTSGGGCFLVGGNMEQASMEGTITAKGYRDAAHTEQVGITQSEP